MPLALTYRFTVLNGTGQTLAAGAVKVKARRWKFTSAGALSYEGSETSIYSNAGTITNGSYDSSSSVDNSSNLFVGGDFYFEVTAPASSSGEVTLYYERSTDGGTTWATSGLGTIVSVLNFTTAGTKGKGFSLT
jgi:hypothetical protein